MNESQKSTDNIITGAVGAFLGSLIGVACIVIVGQLGYVASVSGLVMGVCALKGYEKLGGGLSKKGAVVSILLVLMMTYLGPTGSTGPFRWLWRLKLMCLRYSVLWTCCFPKGSLKAVHIGATWFCCTYSP